MSKNPVAYVQSTGCRALPDRAPVATLALMSPSAVFSDGFPFVPMALNGRLVVGKAASFDPGQSLLYPPSTLNHYAKPRTTSALRRMPQLRGREQ